MGKNKQSDDSKDKSAVSDETKVKQPPELVQAPGSPETKPKLKVPDERQAPDIQHLWLQDVVDHDYDAAFAFLRIRVGKKRAKALIESLREADLVQMRANDILRACELPALSIQDPGTHHNMVKTIRGKGLSPVLVVSLADGRSTIADGYHRVSWAYQISPWVYVPGRLATEGD